MKLEITIDEAFDAGLNQGKKETFFKILEEISQGRDLQYLQMYVKINLDILEKENKDV